MKMWIARTPSGSLGLYREKPYFLDKPEVPIGTWVFEEEHQRIKNFRNVGTTLDCELFPEVTFDNSPMEVELKLIEK